MSVHAHLSPEAVERLKAQRRNTAASSALIAVLLLVLIGVILALFLLPKIETITPDIVSYQGSKDKDESIRERKLSSNVQRKPSSPSSSMARVIASNTASTIAVPVPEEIDPAPSVDLGNGDDFGDGWGDGDGFGGGGGGTTFFGQDVKGERILYIIDYSASMKGDRQRLMRAELAKSIVRIPPDKKFQLIFFAGPAWVAGNNVKMNKKKSAVISSGKEQFKWNSNGKAHAWNPSGNKQKPGWRQALDAQVAASQKVVRKHQLVWGTNWKNPLDMAFRMDPLPQTIVFMTDGLAGGDPEGVARAYAARAKKAGIVIHTIALMEPKAASAMEKLGKGSGGSFALIGKDGKKVKR